MLKTDQVADKHSNASVSLNADKGGGGGLQKTMWVGHKWTYIRIQGQTRPTEELDGDQTGRLM